MSVFHVPSLWRSGERPGPKLAVGVDALATWAGAMKTEDDLWAALLALDGLIVALALAGYDVRQVALGVPAAATTKEWPATALAIVELDLLTVSRGTTLGWAPGSKAKPSVVALWLEPFPLVSARGESVLPRALPLGAAVAAGSADGVSCGATLTLPGWLYLPVKLSGAAWQAPLAAIAEKVAGALRADLSTELGKTWPPMPPVQLPSAGLLALYCPASWRMSPLFGDGETIPEELAELMSAVCAAQETMTAKELLDSELVAQKPASEIVSLGCETDDPLADLMGLCSDLATGQGLPVTEDGPSQDAADYLSPIALDAGPLWRVLMGYQNLGVMDMRNTLAAAATRAWSDVTGARGCVTSTPLLDANLAALAGAPTLDACTYVDVLDSKTVSRKRYVRVRRLYMPEKRPGPELGWVAADALKALGPRPPRPSTPEAQMAALVTACDGWSWTTGNCYGSVKQLILKAGGYGDLLDIITGHDERVFNYYASAKHFADAVQAWGLEAFGLVELDMDPPDAPAGSILVISGTKKKDAKKGTADWGTGISEQHGDISVILSYDGSILHVMNYAKGKFVRSTWSGHVLGLYKPVARS